MKRSIYESSPSVRVRKLCFTAMSQVATTALLGLLSTLGCSSDTQSDTEEAAMDAGTDAAHADDGTLADAAAQSDSPLDGSDELVADASGGADSASPPTGGEHDAAHPLDAAQAVSDGALLPIEDAALNGSDAAMVANDAASEPATADAADVDAGPDDLMDASADAADGAHVNTAPVVQTVPDVGILLGETPAPVTLGLYDAHESDLSLLIVTATSSDQSLVQDANIVIEAGETAATRSLTIVPETGVTGSCEVTLTVEDPAGLSTSETFTFSVTTEVQNTVELCSRESAPESASGNAFSAWPSVSDDGRYVVFETASDNLTSDPTFATDIFVWDRNDETIERITTDSGSNTYGNISGDGLFIAFYSTAALVGEDTNGVGDIYVYDREGESFDLVSVDSAEVPGNAASLASGGLAAARPAISDDGRYVAFASQATNLVASDTNEADDVFLRDRQAGTTTRISVSSSGVEANAHSFQPTLSDDGSILAFSSKATNLIDGETDANTNTDVFVRAAGATTRASQNPDTSALGNAESFDPALSGDGSFLAFTSYASNLVSGDANNRYDVFVWERGTTNIEIVSKAADGTPSESYSGGAWLSDDGNRVVFDSLAISLTGADNGRINTYVVDRTLDTIQLMDVNYYGGLANGGSGYNPMLSGNGSVVVIQSPASNLVLGDTNDAADIFAIPYP